MALFDALIPSAAADVVAVFETSSGRQVFERARPMKATVSESAKLMTHPLEDGSNVVDHRIILPIGVQLSMILDSNNYRDTYQAIRQSFRDSINFTVQTKTDTYQNMYLQDIPHEESPELFDTITIILNFIEAQFTNIQRQALPPDAVRNANDSSTADRGEQTGTDSGDRSSAAFRFLSGAW